VVPNCASIQIFKMYESVAKNNVLSKYHFIIPRHGKTIAFRNVKLLILLIRWGSFFYFSPYQWNKNKKCLSLATSFTHIVLWKANAFYFILYTCFCGYQFLYAPENLNLTDPIQTIHFLWFSTYVFVCVAHFSNLYFQNEVLQLFNSILDFDDLFNGKLVTSYANIH